MSLEATVRVKRGGQYLTIAATSVERYLAKGFDVVGDDGSVIKECTPNDINILRKAFEDHVAEIEALKARIAELEANQKPVAQTAPVKESVKVVEEPEVVATARKRNTKKN